MLLYDKNKKNFTTLTVVDQLVSTGVNIIEVENDSSIWLGGLSPDGFIQVYDLKNNLSISKFDFYLT